MNTSCIWGIVLLSPFCLVAAGVIGFGLWYMIREAITNCEGDRGFILLMLGLMLGIIAVAGLAFWGSTMLDGCF